MDTSRPIISGPPISGDPPSSLGDRQDSQSRRRNASSRRSSSTYNAARGSGARRRSDSRQTQGSTRGRKGYEFTEDVDRGLVKIVDGSDVPFDLVAQAVEDVGGPRKLWLRRRFKNITGTNSFGFLRLLNHRPSADDRKERTRMAMDMTSELDLHMNGPVRPPGDPSSFAYHRATAHDRNADGSSDRRSTLSTASTTRASEHHRVPSESARGAVQSWTAPSSKSPAVEDATDYVSKGNRARALSISSITRQLENLTGNTGFYEFIRRGSIKSHVSPLFRSGRWSRSSRATSGRTSFPETRPYSQIIYVPDPTYQAHYPTPTPDDIVAANSSGAAAVSILLHARMAGMSDAAATAQLAGTFPKKPDDLKSYLDQADRNGVTALHLAAAYGFPHVCSLLMLSGANPRPLTSRGSSVCRFAKPAQELAGSDISLFHRILHSRQWVCAGRPPRLPPEQTAEDKVSPVYAVPVLPTVNESPTPEPETGPRRAPAERTVPDTNPGLTSLWTDLDFLRAAEQEESARPSSIPQVTMSDIQTSSTCPESQNCVHDHGTIADLLTPDSIGVPRSALSWSMYTPSSDLHFRQGPTTPATIHTLEGHGSFGDQGTSNDTRAFGGGLNIIGGNPPNSAMTSTPWPVTQAVPQNFTQSVPRFTQASEEMYANGAEQHHGLPNGLDTVMGNNSVAPGYAGPGQYRLAHGQNQPSAPPQHQAPHYSASNVQSLYLTPPEESSWSRNQVTRAQQWSNWDVSQATARALEQQMSLNAYSDAGWNGDASNGSQGSSTNGEYIYYPHHPTHAFE